MAIRIGALLSVALLALTSVASAQTTTPRPAAKPKAKPVRTQPAPKPQDDQSYFALDLPDSPGGKPPNYVYQSQNQSVFRGSMVGGDSTLFGGNFGVTNPGLR
jgi:curli biogenesis system outer membrane secretion channel CsgG